MVPSAAETPPRVAEFVLAAGEYVRRAIALPLDGTVESLAFLDHYVAKVRQDGEVAEELLELLAPAVGSYLGELVIARLGGTWDARAAHPGDWTITVPGPPEGGAEDPRPLFSFRPVAMAACALRGEDLDEYDPSIAPAPDLAAPLAEALASASPVEADYFYSLTGRYESLEHVTDLLIAFRRAGLPPDEDASAEADG